MNPVGGAAAKLAVFVAIVAVCSAFVIAALRIPVPDTDVSHSAQFTDISGLYEGDVVRMSGVAVGKVESVDLDGTLATVRFTVDGSRPIYDNTQAAVRYQNLIGQRYIELMNQQPTGTRLASGANIPVRRTIPSFDVSKLFNGFKPLFSTLDTEQLNQFGQNMLRVLQGDGAGIGPLLADLDRLTAFARDREALIVLLIRNLGEISREIGGKSVAVGDLVKELGGILRQFSSKTSTLVNAVTDANRALEPLVPLLEELEASYDDSYPPLAGLLRRLLPQTGQVVEILSLVPSLLTGLNNNMPADGFSRTFTCGAGEAGIPGIGQVVLGNQNLVVCK
ncbi:MlaD family protein [Nocardia sp. GCM10030253]|uniref:MlaD family protein n=1 Tax=Nocardia sp. GCM10030253 TaxID=3273404 RepID=UPI00362C79E3